MAKIVNGDNFNGDYPNESFVFDSSMSKERAELIALILNAEWSGDDATRFWRVVENDYKLAPGFKS